MSSTVTSLDSQFCRVALLPVDGHNDDGRLLGVESDIWDMRPSPAEIAEAAQRGEGRCRLGRPLYQPGDIPTSVLATVPELERMRLRPHPGQPPLASRKKKSGGTDDLYATALAEPIPAKSPRDKARQERARTCAECHATSKVPFKEGDDGKHYCATHLDEANARTAHQAVADQSFRAVLWARELMLDPATVLVGTSWDREIQGYRLRVETFSSDVVVDRLLPRLERHIQTQKLVKYLPSWVSDPDAHTWTTSRIIEAPIAHAVAAYRDLLRAVSADTSCHAPNVHKKDNFSRRYTEFIQPLAAPDTAPVPGYADAEPVRPHTSQSAADVIEQMRTVLREMGDTALTEEQIKRAKRRPRQPKLNGVERIRRDRLRATANPDGNPSLLASRLYRDD
ncbi:hypothetical protein [Amycolatopsis sp. CA-230715]|uniref:hypothetical protein n=1 Tax=Amycolatopsis sp. CA-230715 TaxID=2745196 RepID=UPI001C0307B3|nr:hypothetical protein [Amycolatopsis sp. CA-230715]